MQYENHMLEKKLLPFIFHFNIINKEMGMGANDFGNWHENPEFLLCTSGKGKVIYNKYTYEIEKDDLVIVNSDCFHSVLTDDEVEYFCLIVDVGFLKDNGIPIDSINYRHIVKKTELIKLFEKIREIYETKPLFYCTKIRTEVLKLVTNLTENYASLEKTKEDFPLFIKDAFTYIKMHYNENVTIEDIVGYVGFSRAYFSREFKKYTGIPIITYLNYIRCSQARILLASGSATVSQAAEYCGFKNLSYFSKIYKRLMGVLPSEDVQKTKNGNTQIKVVKNHILTDESI